MTENTRKPLNEKEQIILKQYNSGMIKQVDISKLTGIDTATVCRGLKHIKKEYPELLNEQPQKPTEKPKKQESIESKPEPEKAQKKANTKPQKDYFKLDLGEYGTYIRDMAWYNRTTATAYIQDLIAKDAAENSEIWKKIKN